MMPRGFYGYSTYSRIILDRKSTRLNSSHTDIYTFPYTTLFRSEIGVMVRGFFGVHFGAFAGYDAPRILRVQHLFADYSRSEEHTSELQSHRYLHLSLHDALPI